MEEIKPGSVDKVRGSEIGPQSLKGMFARLELPEWVVSKGGRESFRKGKPTVYGRWGVSYEALSEREALEGLKFVDELDLSEVKSRVSDLTSALESVKSELEECKEGISELLGGLRERPVVKQTELFEIDEALEIIRPIPVVIEEYSDEVIASFPEIEAFGAGLCEAEAITDLKSEIRRIFFELEGISAGELGKLPLSWKRVLSKVVRKVGNRQ